jgi:protein-S-isoprenylcysteine O-methyltransferase Ste14
MAAPEFAHSHEPGYKLILRGAAWLGILSLVFIGAWDAGWARLAWFAGLMVATVILNISVLAVVNPRGLRARAGRMRIEHPQERRFVALSYLSMLGILSIAFLDTRFGWSSPGPLSLWVGIALHAAGLGPVLWTLAVNPWAERSVRVQHDRGQQVVSTGPYRFVRHPMYFGVLLMEAGWPLILGSYWAYTSWALFAWALSARAIFEEDLLRRELDGYDAYLRRTPYRMVPGIW